MAHALRLPAPLTLPTLIQGGMGVSVSGWRLAAAVSRLGQLGVVSGTAAALALARGLQDGDHGGHLRRALAAFADQAISARIIERYFRPGGRRRGGSYRAVPVPRQRAGRAYLEITIAGSFVQVHLAKQGHDGPVGFNLLEKIQIPTLPSLYGAMLAGVDWILMGAGIPLHIPAAIDALSQHRRVALPLHVAGARGGEEHAVSFDPKAVLPDCGAPLPRPRFIAIVSSHVLAAHLAGDPVSCPSGFVVETPIAGGHNAPPRGRMRLADDGQPVYGPRDEVDLQRMRDLSIPFWLAGGYGHPHKLEEALQQGASGVQIGTAFALCEESGLERGLKRAARERAAAGSLVVRTEPTASPTGFPFKVAQLPHTLADDRTSAARERRCDLGFLASPYLKEDGRIGYRCPAEPVEDYVGKGGERARTAGRICLCNGLTAAAGIGQARAHGSVEPPLLTLGDDVNTLLAEISPDGAPYRAADVVAHMLTGVHRAGVVCD